MGHDEPRQRHHGAQGAYGRPSRQRLRNGRLQAATLTTGWKVCPVGGQQAPCTGAGSDATRERGKLQRVSVGNDLRTTFRGTWFALVR